MSDAWGCALLDHLEGRPVQGLQLETGDGHSTDAMHPEWFFRTFDAWDPWDRELLPLVTDGPVLDLGAGAGRAALYFQDRGLDVVAVDNSPGAVEVCRRRGVHDSRLGDLTVPPIGHRWGAVLLLCGNLGLPGSWDGTRALLRDLARSAAPGAVLIGDTVDPGGPGAVRLRLRYRGMATTWWDQYNFTVGEIAPLVDGTGWVLERHVVALPDHAVLLRRVP